ncbi:MAG: proline iminopeptidase-family hydrolase [Bacteroidota bacterium]
MVTNLLGRLQAACILISFAVLSACTAPASNKEAASSDLQNYFTTTETGIKSGGVQLIPIKTPKGEFKVWTKRFGNNPKIKVLLLHGGPGCTHEYFESFESFLPQEGIEFIYYDQLGSAYSDQPKDTSLWDLPRFVEEVEQVRVALGLNKDNFYLLGHSWGGILAMQYALKYQGNLKGLIISNMMADCPKYGQYADNVLAKQMAPEVLKEIQAIEAKGDFSNPRYMELLMPNFYEKHILCRPTAEWPDAVNRTFAKLNQEIYVSMQGPSEFGVSGKLEKWDVSKQLPNIKTRTLVIGAAHDTMDPEYMRWMSTQFPNGQFLLCPGGGHMCMWDDQSHYFPGLIHFLKGQ